LPAKRKRGEGIVSSSFWTTFSPQKEAGTILREGGKGMIRFGSACEGERKESLVEGKKRTRWGSQSKSARLRVYREKRCHVFQKTKEENTTLLALPKNRGNYGKGRGKKEGRGWLRKGRRKKRLTRVIDPSISITSFILSQKRKEG